MKDIRLNNQQRDWLVDNLNLCLDELDGVGYSDTSKQIMNQILKKLNESDE